MALTHILPDPTHPINTAGQSDAGGTAGPGYAAVKVSSVQPLMKFASNAWRRDVDEALYHRWRVNIDYNPLTCEQFHTIFAFINYRQSSLIPFYVSVPPFSSQVLAGITAGSVAAEDEAVMLTSGTGVQVGYLFNVAGSTKAYKVTRVETETDYVGTSPGAGNERIHFTPSLQETVLNNTSLTFTDPLFLVELNTDTFNYTIDQDGLFLLSLDLIEVLPDVS